MSDKQRFTGYTEYVVKQLLPAPGWHCFGARYDDKEVSFFELPVVGWALCTSTHTRKTWEGRECVNTEVTKYEDVNLLSYNYESSLVMPIDEWIDEYTVVDAFLSKTLDDFDVKDKLQQKLQDKMVIADVQAPTEVRP